MAGKKGRSGGHNKKSLAEHKLEGTFRNDLHGGLIVPVERLSHLDIPYFMQAGSDVSKQTIFNTFSDYLHNQGQTQEEHGILLSLLVDQIVMYRDVMQLYESAPKNERATLKIDRKLASSVLLEISRSIIPMLSEFHLTPNTRVPLIEGTTVEVNENESLMNGS
ncbi:hypothetical protein [Neptunicoccus sediminis]|uniref:hypothetical protein n=1 Tax=Neptunicoccus sediminis TaxID=1892596 RepID=UPI0012FFCCE2|nr:hypothetical protein [Neptunicoccus sediminis]